MKNIRRIVFFGTHELAVPCLEKLVELELSPLAVVTRPRVGLQPGPFSREEEELPPHPVIEWCREKGIEVIESDDATEPELRDRIGELKPDLLVVGDYGRPLPPDLIATAARKALEVHPSLLPKLRGEHAVRVAIANGEKKSGVSVFLPDEDPWGGPILLSEEYEIETNAAYFEIFGRVEALTKELLEQGLTKVDKAKNPKARKQNPKAASHTPKLNQRHRRAPWHLEADAVYDRLRAHSPPGLLTSCRLRSFEIVSGRPLKLVESPYGETGTYLGVRARCL
ncbi:MAG: hypothetical protein MI919_06995, partial [Holophagales bacterium]|nr:hypothetical protein [Holophagales bacterium]